MVVTEATDDGTLQQPCEQVIFDPQRGKLVVDFRAVARRPIKFLRLIGPFLTAHHPLCSHFGGHTISVRHRTYCVGCLFNTLSFFSAFGFFLLLWMVNPLLAQRSYLFYGGIGAVIISLLISATGLTSNMKIKILAKFLLGAGFAAITVSILVAGDDILLNIDGKILFILLMYLPVMTIMNAKRMWEIENACKDCEHKMRWSRCPGFKDIICKTIVEGFVKRNDT